MFQTIKTFVGADLQIHANLIGKSPNADFSTHSSTSSIERSSISSLQTRDAGKSSLFGLIFVGLLTLFFQLNQLLIGGVAVANDIQTIEWLPNQGDDINFVEGTTDYGTRFGLIITDISKEPDGFDNQYEITEDSTIDGVTSTKTYHTLDSSEHDFTRSHNIGSPLKDDEKKLVPKNNQSYFTYGDWYISRHYRTDNHSSCTLTHCQFFAFKPNSDAIKNIAGNQTVTFTFKSLYYENWNRRPDIIRVGDRIDPTETDTVRILIRGPVVHSIEATWNSEIQTDTSGNPILLLESSTTTTYSDLNATLAVANPSNAPIVINTTYSGERFNREGFRSGDTHAVGALPRRISNLPAGFAESSTLTFGSGEVSPPTLGSNTPDTNQKKLRVGYWLFDSANHLLTFRPSNDADYGIPSLKPGDLAISQFRLDMIQNGSSIATISFRVTMRYTGVRLSWVNEESGTIVETGASSYEMFEGNAFIASPSSNYSVTFGGRDSGMSDSTPDIEPETTAVFGYGREIATTYGKWLLKTNNSAFRFDPDADAINQLNGDTVTTTLNIEVTPSSGGTPYTDSISVTITSSALRLSIESGDTVTEADDALANFTVTATLDPGAAVKVYYTVTATSNFLLAPVPDLANRTNNGHESDAETSVDMTFVDRSEAEDGSGPFTYILEIPLRDNGAADSGQQSVTVTLNSNTNGDYLVTDAKSSASVTIIEAESLPLLTFEADNNLSDFEEPDTEGSLAFIITSSVMPKDTYPDTNSVEIDVYYIPSQTGDFIDSTNGNSPNKETSAPLAFTEHSSTGIITATLSIPVEADNIGEPTGSITVTLSSSKSMPKSYRLGTDMTRNSHEVKVYDNDLPELSVSIDETEFTEGDADSVQFTVSARFKTESRVRLDFEVRELSPFTEKVLIPRYITFQDPVTLDFSNSTTQPLDITIKDDSDGEESYRYVEVTLYKRAGYTVADDGDKARILIVDDDSRVQSVVNISSDSESVTEGQEIVFNVNVFPPPTQDVRVSVSVTQLGDFTLWEVPDSVVVSSSGAKLAVSTFDDDVDESDGSVTARVLPGSGYGQGATATVEVKDNDSSTTTETKFTVASQVISDLLSRIRISSTQRTDHANLLEFSIRAVKGVVEEGEPAEFVIFTTQETAFPTTVNVNLSQSGDFVIGEMRRSVVVLAGQSKSTLVIKTDDDELAEADGMITVKIEMSSEYQRGSQSTAYVFVSDAKDRLQRTDRVSGVVRSVLPDLLVRSTTESLEIASERVTQAFTGNPTSYIDLTGKSPIRKMSQYGEEILNSSKTDWQSLVDGSSFTIVLNPGGGKTSSATVWGIGGRHNHSGSGAGEMLSWEAESISGQFGFDAVVGQGVLTGLAVSVSQAEINYGQDEYSGITMDAQTTGVHPYLGLSSQDGNTRVHVLAGYGDNKLELKQEDYSPEFLNGQFHTFGFGGSSLLFGDSKFNEVSNFDLRVSGEVWHSQQTVDSVEGVIDNLEMSVRHARIAVEATRDFRLAVGEISPSVSIGLRGDGRDEETYIGMDVGSGVKYGTFNGLGITGSGKSLLSGINLVHGWEIESSLDYDSGNDDRGFLFSISSSLRGTGTNAQRYIWGEELLNVASDSIASDTGRSLEAEIGYGFEVLDGLAVMIPNSALRLTDSDGNEFQIGSRITTNSGIDFELEAVRHESESGTSNNKYNLAGSINW